MSNYTVGTFKDGSKGWKAVPYPKDKQVGFSTHEIHWSDDGECVAEVVHGEADAMLIAAAPDMLTALKILRAYFGEHDKTITEHTLFAVADNAIKSALGQP